ncbi:MAG: hypothetical protein Q9M28_03470, partial [Mariprofundaceae bacterium]|nr:hypothetical protein [Mariprofundaceae bacterium]
LNQFFNHFGFEQHPDKTFIGRTNKGFDWLGFQLNHTGIVGVSVRSLGGCPRMKIVARESEIELDFRPI